jgi:hypothetical protein
MVPSAGMVQIAAIVSTGVQTVVSSPASTLQTPYQKKNFLNKSKETLLCLNSEARSRNHSRRGKTMRVTYSECVFVALVIQYTTRMRVLTVPSLACLTVP